MTEIFANSDINEKANSILSEINEIVSVLENVDRLMPSASLELKNTVSPEIKAKFYSISENPVEFFDSRIVPFKKTMQHIKEEVGATDPNYRSIGDAITICGCKILQFDIGKVSWLVNQKGFRRESLLANQDSDLLFEVKQRLHILTEFDPSEVGRNEIIKTDKLVIKLSKKLEPQSLLKRLFKL